MAEPLRKDVTASRPLLSDFAFGGSVGLILAVLTSWPLVLRLGSDVPHDDGDPLLQTWQVAWIGHAWLHQPLQLFQANTFWPLPDSLAFSDALIGYSPASLLAQLGPHAAVVVYDLLFLFAYALAFLGAYLLARELGLRRPGAVVAGAAFAYAPWRFAQDGHLHVLSSGGIPLALALLLRGYRRSSGGTVVAGWLVAAWQLSLGFTLGLQLTTLLAVLVVVAALALRPQVRRRLNGRLVAATALGVAAFCLVALLQARPYLRVVDAHPEARRSLVDVFRFSPPLNGFLAAPEHNAIWGRLTSRARETLPFPDEQTLFPGLAISMLAVVGLFARALPRRLRIGLALGVIVCVVLSLGIRSTPFGYATPYRLLYEFVPGWSGIRTPGRLNTLTSLGLALLAGAGATAVAGATRRRLGSHRRAARIAPAVAALLTVVIVIEGRGWLAHPTVPEIPAAQRRAIAPILHLPSDGRHDLRSTYWSVDGFVRVANGSSGFEPRQLVRLRQAVRSFPDRASVAALRAYGIRSVIIHPDLAVGSPWSTAAERSVSGLPLSREVVDGAVLFRLTGSP